MLEKGSTCFLCQDVDILKTLPDKRRGALVGSVRKLSNDQFEAYVSRFPEHPDFQEELRRFVGQAQKRLRVPAHAEAVPEHARAPPDVDSPPKRQQLLIALPQETLSQGRFGLCSAYAVATATSHSLGAKYSLCIGASRLVDRWIDHLPHKAMWPHDFANSLHSWSLKTDAFHYVVRLKYAICEDFDKAGEVVKRCGGWRCVVVVMSFDDERNHSVVAIKFNNNGTLTCQNSWGENDHPFLIVGRQNFCKAFFFDPIVEETWEWKGGVRVKCAGPVVDAEWAFMNPM